MHARGIALVLTAAALAAPAAARADEEIVAGGGFRFLNPNVTIDQGERLTFRNADVARHDVASVQPGTVRRQYLFASEIIGQGETSFVEGSQYLTTGTYEFVCSLHAEQMKGKLTVTSNGTPAPRPGAGGGDGGGDGGGGDDDPAAEDLRGPVLSLRLGPTKVRAMRRSRQLSVKVGSDEGARIRLTIRVGTRRIARTSLRLRFAGTRRVAIARDRTARRALRRGRRLTVGARATDAAGNPGAARLSQRLR